MIEPRRRRRAGDSGSRGMRARPGPAARRGKRRPRAPTRLRAPPRRRAAPSRRPGWARRRRKARRRRSRTAAAAPWPRERSSVASTSPASDGRRRPEQRDGARDVRRRRRRAGEDLVEPVAPGRAVRTLTPGATDVGLERMRAVDASTGPRAEKFAITSERSVAPDRERRPRRSPGTAAIEEQLGPYFRPRRPRRSRRRAGSRRPRRRIVRVRAAFLSGQVQELLTTSAPSSGRGFSPFASVGARKNSKHSM